MNSEYDWLLSYLQETYGVSTALRNVKYEFVIKNKDSIMPGPIVGYNATETFGKSTQIVEWHTIADNETMNTFFRSWDNFEEGWNIVASLVVYSDDPKPEDVIELFTTVSNEVPITQELFSKLINGGSKKIIDLEDMNITQYTVVNKIENKIIQIERPNASKDNIVQPVFYRVKDLETLTLHPLVTENISINLDDYKSKVTLPDSVSELYIPSIAEMQAVRNNLDVINTALEAAGGVKFVSSTVDHQLDLYWTVSENESSSGQAAALNPFTGELQGGVMKSKSKKVRFIFAF
jgi:hypothetical protein